jgi:two-component system, NarL family, response regulator LiaR
MMKTLLYAEEMNLLDILEQGLKSLEYTVVETLEGCFESIVVCFLEGDIRANEPLIRSLIDRQNRVLLLQRVPRIEPAKHYLSLGVSGYGNVIMDPLFLHAAIESLKKGMVWLHPEIIARMVEMLMPSFDNREFLQQLSEREQEIALLLLEGKTYNAVADKLSITPRTVKAHTTSIFHKLQVKDRLDFALQYK